MMNIEELSKAQLMLLTILVNFVTAIATAILTVSLLDQAPQVVTQTINRVVDHTIEKVVQSVPSVIAPSSPAPSNQDLVTTALAMDAERFVYLFDAKTGTSTPAFAIGTYLSKARAIATISREALPNAVLVSFANGVTATASISRVGNGVAIYGFSDSVKLPDVSYPTLIASKDLKIGQTALAISNENAAATGIVAKVDGATIRTTLPDIGGGNAAVDLSGNLIGIGSGSGTPGALISAETITKLLASTSSPATP